MSSKQMHSAIAIVGIAIELPSGNFSKDNLDYHSFWEFLLQKRDSYENVPEERLHGLAPGFSVDGTFLKNIDKFDNVEFGIGTKDAKGLAMSTRKLLELSFRAMLDSGTNYRGKRFGSFMCGTGTDLFGMESDRSVDTNSYAFASRMSYLLDITGPSLYVDTACSSSLTAMHLALQAIQNGECEGAIVGGCQINANLFDWDVYKAAGVVSADNSCKPFDADANGFSKAEGAAVIVLKPLEAALADNDHIYSVVLGSSINSNGARASLHAPSGIAQQECILEAFAKAGRDPTEVDFVELHATGTVVGDPIEVNAAGEIFARDENVFIGSVKGNTGHVESAAFLTSLAKVCLMLEHQMIPPNAHFTEPSTNIFWDKYRLRVATKPITLGCRSSTGRSLISMASSGIGGSNGHIVIEGPPAPADNAIIMANTPVLFVIGGLSPKTVQSLSNSIIQILTEDSSLQALSQAVTMARRARQLPWRTHFTYVPGFASTLKAPSPVLAPKISPPVIMVFSGQGPQHVHMGRKLFHTYKVFRDTILELDEVYERVTGVSLVKTTGLFDGKHCSLSGLWPTEITLPTLTMVQIALFDLLQSIGIKPDVVFGHSAGETALLYASGAGSKAMALEIAIPRARGMVIAEYVGGGMAALGCDLQSTLRIVGKVKETSDGVLEVACHNSPEAFVISGHAKLVDEAIALAQKDGIFARKLHTATPSHSSVMEICKEKYLSGIAEVFSRYPQHCVPTIPTFSTVAGHDEMISEFTPDYFWQNMRSPVIFQQTVETIVEEYPDATFIEISPHPVLSSYIFASAQREAVCPMRREKDGSASDLELLALKKAIGSLFISGVNSIDLTALYGPASRDLAYQIPYPFTARHFPMRIDGPRIDGHSSSDGSALRLKMNSKLFPDLAQHVINGAEIVPAAAFIDMVVQSGARVLWDVEFNAILSLQSESPVDVRVQREQNKWNIVTTQGSDVRVHCKGLCSSNGGSEVSPVDISALRERLAPMELKGFHDALLPLANFGPLFQRLEYLASGPNEWFAEINSKIEVPSGTAYKIHPVLLDSCLHFVLHPDIIQSPNKDTIFLPKILRRFTFRSSPALGGAWYSHVKMVEWTPKSRVYDINVYDSLGMCICTMYRMELHEVSVAPPIAVKKRYELVYQPVVIDIPIKLFTEALHSHDDSVVPAYRWLDLYSQKVVAKALKSEPVVGNELDRKRFHSWAKEAETRQLPTAPSSIDADLVRSAWPEAFQVTERLVPIYPQIFSSSGPAIDALFSDDVMAGLYERHFHRLLDYTTHAFEDTIAQLSSGGKRVLKVLETGSGTGTLTKRLTKVLEKMPEVTAQYLATDVSYALAFGAASVCSYPRVIPKAYDLGKPIEDQGFTPGSIDVVTAFLVLHATPNISSTLAYIYKLLSPGGSLLFIELDGDVWEETAPPDRRAGTLWFDFIFGSFAEWHGATDGRQHCIMRPETWRSALEIVGFTNVQFAVDPIAGLGFTLSAQKPSQLPPVTLSTSSNTSFLTFKYGEETHLQEQLYQLNTNEPLTVWLLAPEGVDGDAAAGFTPTLAREFTQWKICTAIFPIALCEEPDRIQAILRHREYLADEQIVRFDTNGDAHVAKVVPLLLTPCKPIVFDPNAVWVSDGTLIQQAVMSKLEEHEVTIEVLAWSEGWGSWRGFVGTVTESCAAGILVGSHFVSITESTLLSNLVQCRAAMLAPIDELDAFLAEDALPMVIGALALGATRLEGAGYGVPPLRVLFPQATRLDQLTAQFLKNPTLAAYVSLNPPSEDEQFSLIIVDSSTASVSSELGSWLIPETGELFIWDTLLRRTSKKDPWSIGRALKAGLRLRDAAVRMDSAVTRPQELVKTLSVSVPEVPLFRGDKVYIILGGASDLGVHMSLWMYQNGARHIVLTSRRGSAFFDQSASVPTKQKLGYLKGIPGLELRTESFDATSAEAMSTLSQSISLPIGGCFIATLVLIDKLFMSQRPADFHTVSELKLNVFKAFRSAFDVKSLDFLVSLSSMVTVVGNPGQSNYAVANALLDGVLSKYTNAVSLLLPAISGVGFFDRMAAEARSDLGSETFTPDEICASIGDALLILASGQHCPSYILDLGWNKWERVFGLPSSCRHLVTRNQVVESSAQASPGSQACGLDQVLDMILNLLDVAKEDFSPIVPFTSFGLDSLGATRISAALRPYTIVSQMQLLGGISWQQIEGRISSKKK